ncbi:MULTISPECIES: YitT family protein [Paenibacillus]|uniref:Membrane protein n=1 Tax=Paenibacillus albilobatus TaxID=2716884 RepID=A0A919XHY8_9BACL|nr:MULTISPECIES: YitT family protein [Paenibacillus]MDR9852761.1 YitT family protein [Paenibacillus sp. VCA1]GIO30678.1 membrane protein [Paenibacillus albilobatus]
MRKKDHLISKFSSIAMMLFGTFLLAFAYYHINFQNHLSEGGFVGLSLLGKYVLGINPALSTLLLDIPVILIAMFLKGRKFVMHTLLATLSFSIFYELIERYSVLVIDLHDNLLLAALLSGLVTGIATGLVLRFGGATGGDDILSLLISRWSGLKVGTVFILLDAAVLLLSLFYMPLKETLFTILAVGIAGQTITFTVSFRKGKTVDTAVPEPAISPKNATKPVHAVRSAH